MVECVPSTWAPRPLLKGERLVSHPAVPTVQAGRGATLGFTLARILLQMCPMQTFSPKMLGSPDVWLMGTWRCGGSGGVGAGGPLLTLVPAPLNSNGRLFLPSDNTDPRAGGLMHAGLGPGSPQVCTWVHLLLPPRC